MKVSLDGGVTYIDAPEGVRVIVTGLNDGDYDYQLHLHVTHEGVISDVWSVAGNDQPGEIVATGSRTFGEIIEAP